MIRLWTTGALDLRQEDGTEAQSVLRQPKRFALLVYLALARPRGFQRRDRVLAMFWPELGQDRARHALSQSVFYLRRSLGREIVVNRGDEEIGIGPGRLWCDAVAFDEAIERGELEEALELYRGELLSGFHLDDAPEFERWLDEERLQRTQRAADAAWSLAESAGRAGDFSAARAWAERAVGYGSWDERGLRRLMTLLDDAGDRAGAVAAFHDFASRLHAELEVEPSAETLELFEAIKARAEPNGGPEPPPIVVRTPAAEPPLVPVATAATRSSPSAAAGFLPRVRRAAWRFRWVALVAVVVLAIGLLVPLFGASSDPDIRVAVLPVRDETPQRQYAHITAALTSNIIRLMHHPPRLQVVSEFGVRRFAQSHPTPQEIGRELDVQYIVSGLLTGSGDQIKVTIELIDATDGEFIDGQTVEKGDADWIAFTENVGIQLATLLRSRLGEIDLRRTWLAGTSSVRAWEAVVRASDLLTRAIAAEDDRELDYARDLLDEADSLLWLAAREDRSWCVPFALLARTTERRAFMSLADPSMTAADRAMLFDTADAYADRALAADRNEASLWELRGTLMHRRYLFAPPGPAAAEALLDSAEANVRRALELEPTLARAASTLSMVFLARGQMQQAFDYASQAFENDAYLTEMDNIAHHLFEVAFHLDDAEASRWCSEVASRMPDTFPAAMCALKQISWGEKNAMSGRNALYILETFGAAEEPAARESMRPCLVPLAVPAVAADPAMGPDSARAMLERARQQGSGYLDWTCAEYEAAALAAIGDNDGAFDRLEDVLEELPHARARLAASRYFRPLQADTPRWRELFDVSRPGETQVQMSTPLTK